MGLAFVGWTRVTTWSKMAFRALPPLDCFTAIRRSAEFKRRAIFESYADTAHDAYMASIGISPLQELEMHMKHLTKSTWQVRGAPPTAEEIDDIRNMMTRRGVQPAPDTKPPQGMSVGTTGMSQIAQSFKGCRKMRLRSGIMRAHAGADPENEAMLTTLDALCSMGFELGRARNAAQICGCDLSSALEMCLDDSCLDAPIDHKTPAERQVKLLTDMGFDAAEANRALHACNYVMADALELIMRGPAPSQECAEQARKNVASLACWSTNH